MAQRSLWELFVDSLRRNDILRASNAETNELVDELSMTVRWGETVLRYTFVAFGCTLIAFGATLLKQHSV